MLKFHLFWGKYKSKESAMNAKFNHSYSVLILKLQFTFEKSLNLSPSLERTFSLTGLIHWWWVNSNPLKLIKWFVENYIAQCKGSKYFEVGISFEINFVRFGLSRTFIKRRRRWKMWVWWRHTNLNIRQSFQTNSDDVIDQ